MSKGVNSVRILGNIGRDLEIRTIRTGKVVSFSVGTSERKKLEGSWVDHTEWHNVVMFGNIAEIAEKYLAKGSQVYIEGKLRTESWDDKKHGDRRYRTVIVAEDMVLLGTKNIAKENAPAADFAPHAEAQRLADQDVPF